MPTTPRLQGLYRVVARMEGGTWVQDLVGGGGLNWVSGTITVARPGAISKVAG